MKITVITKDGIKKRRNVKVGSPFSSSIEQRASFDGVHWFKVLVNGSEVFPWDSPAIVEEGMDIVLAHEDVEL